MAGKRFFWLKLKEDFFQQKAMKKLRRIERGEVLTIIYLKLQLASLRTGGIIAFEGLGDSLAEELSLQLDEREEDVTATVDFLIRCGLMEQIGGADTYILPSAIESTGSESDSAARVRAFRERQALQCNGDSMQNDEALQCNDRERVEKKREDLELDSERERDSAAAPPAPARDSRNLIFLDDGQYKALVADLGEPELKRCVDYLSEYCAMHNRKYGDWDAAIRKCSREGWGKDPKHGGAGADFQPTADRIKRNGDWLDGFLAQQKKQKDLGAKTNKL